MILQVILNFQIEKVSEGAADQSGEREKSGGRRAAGESKLIQKLGNERFQRSF